MQETWTDWQQLISYFADKYFSAKQAYICFEQYKNYLVLCAFRLNEIFMNVGTFQYLKIVKLLQ